MAAKGTSKRPTSRKRSKGKLTSKAARKSAARVQGAKPARTGKTATARIRDRDGNVVGRVAIPGGGVGSRTAAQRMADEIVADLREASPAPTSKPLGVDVARIGRVLGALGGERVPVTLEGRLLDDEERSMRARVWLGTSVRDVLLENTASGVRVWLAVAEPGATIGSALTSLLMLGEHAPPARRVT